MTPPNGISRNVGTNSEVLKENYEKFKKHPLVQAAKNAIIGAFAPSRLAQPVYITYKALKASNEAKVNEEALKSFLDSARPVPLATLVKGMPMMDQISIRDKLKELPEQVRTGNHMAKIEELKNK